MRIYSLGHAEDGSSSIVAELLRTLKPHSSPVIISAIDSTGTLLATGSADGTVKVWDIRRGYITHTFHGHSGVISALHFFEVASGGQNGDRDKSKKSIKKGRRKSANDEDLVMGDLNESPASGFRLASGSEDGKARIWDLHKRKSLTVLDSHVSVVRALAFSGKANALLSASRDKTVILWDTRTWKTKKVIPVLESVEAAGFVGDGDYCYTGGEKGRIRIWETNSGREVTPEQEAGGENDAIIGVECSLTSSYLLSIHADQTLRLHSLAPLSFLSSGVTIDPLPILRQISGNHDEIIDVACVGPDRSLLALATNSESIRIVSLGSPGATIQSKQDEMSYDQDYFGADITHLIGHEDIIICLDVDWSGHWLATGAKDNTARLWRLDPEKSSYICFATFSGHAESIGAIALPRSTPLPDSAAFTDPINHPPAFLLTGSQDRTIKNWDTSKLQSPDTSSAAKLPRAVYTRKAHDKDINALDVSHSPIGTTPLFASASQDRTVKIWSLEDGSTLGVLRGHKRGVWSVRFAPKETPAITSDSGSTTRGLILTGSGDKTVKIWSLNDYTCLRTFEGHTNSVLKVLWLPPSTRLHTSDRSGARGPLIASAGGDGLVKIWNVKAGEIETTLDNHTDRVWALSTPPAGSASPFQLISGAADATVSFWKDTTSTTMATLSATASARTEQDQQLQNFIHAQKYREAIILALQLNHPARLLSLFSAVIATDPPEPGSLTGVCAVDSVLQSLHRDQLFTLLLRVRDWNTNASTAPVAQRILWVLVRSYPASTFAELTTIGRGVKGASGASIREVLDALRAYTERHYRRMEDLVDESYLLDFMVREMDDVGFAKGVEGV